MTKEAHIRGRGLSPRVRGNQSHLPAARRRPGSIPACAGEPKRTRLGKPDPTVYPRVCGGTCKHSIVNRDQQGLSPRVRGNRPLSVPGRGLHGSIPACAGEPHVRGHVTCFHTVYPRVCGGTQLPPRQRLDPLGLSPRVRGNQSAPDLANRTPRSIPACAGEPENEAARRARNSVYPRVCGGTWPWRAKPANTSGLSPRVRGNHWAIDASMGRTRSIPACAGEPGRRINHRVIPAVYPRVCGEPQACCLCRGPKRVYPRVCGGTAAAHCVDARQNGLSPRVRGNRQ